MSMPQHIDVICHSKLWPAVKNSGSESSTGLMGSVAALWRQQPEGQVKANSAPRSDIDVTDNEHAIFSYHDYSANPPIKHTLH